MIHTNSKRKMFSCIMLFSFFSGLFGCQAVTIVEPQKGNYTDSASLDVAINFEGDSSLLQVKLNGSDITQDLTVSAGTASGTITDLQPGLNEIKGTLEAATDTTYFMYMPDGVPSGMTALGTEKNYQIVVDEQHHSALNASSINYAEYLGYSPTVLCPFKLASGDELWVGGFLHVDGSSDLNEGAYVISYNGIGNGMYPHYYTILARQISPFVIEFFDDNNRIVLDCSAGLENCTTTLTRDGSIPLDLPDYEEHCSYGMECMGDFWWCMVNTGITSGICLGCFGAGPLAVSCYILCAFGMFGTGWSCMSYADCVCNMCTYPMCN